MVAVRTTVFKSNKVQAVRLPKVVALPESVKKVDIIAVGTTRIITPAGESWNQWFASKGASDDFMDEREQPVKKGSTPFNQEGVGPEATHMLVMMMGNKKCA